jgi:hypothetical protein
MIRKAAREMPTTALGEDGMIDNLQLLCFGISLYRQEFS